MHVEHQLTCATCGWTSPPRRDVYAVLTLSMTAVADGIAAAVHNRFNNTEEVEYHHNCPGVE